MSSRVPKITTGPAKEPITVEDLADHLNYSKTSKLGLLEKFIKAATEHWQKYTRQLFITQDVTEKYNCWGEVGDLYYWPVQSIVSVTYKNTSDGTTNITSKFELNDYADPACIALKDGESLPSDMKDGLNVITVVVRCGYGDDETDVPWNISQAISLLAAAFFINRKNPEKRREMWSLAHELMALEKRY